MSDKNWKNYKNLGTKRNNYIAVTFCTWILANFYKDLGTKSNDYIDVTFCTKTIFVRQKSYVWSLCTKSNDYIAVTFCTQSLVILKIIDNFTRIWVQKVTTIYMLLFVPKKLFLYKKKHLYSCYFLYPDPCKSLQGFMYKK